MALSRFYCELLNESEAELSASEAHHLVSVMRLSVGEKVELFDGKGGVATASITTIKKNNSALKVETFTRLPRPKRPAVIIASSIAKGERFDRLITGLTELGVDRIVPTIFERTVKLSANPGVIDRWQNLAISAAKQCRRNFLPVIDPPRPLPKVVETLKKDYPSASLLFGSPADDLPSLTQISCGPADTIAFIGPEGGLTQSEELFLKSNNCIPVRLTDTILRIETASFAFAAVLCCRRESSENP